MTKSIKDTVENMSNDEYNLRIMLWLRHGCEIHNLYGDDGEIHNLYGDDGEKQCNKCMIDFIRDDVKLIVEKIANDKLTKYIKENPEWLNSLKK